MAKCGRPQVDAGGHIRSLHHRADAAGLAGAASLAGPRVGAVSSAVCGQDVGEGFVETFGFGLHAIPERSAVLGGIDQDAGHGARGDVEYVVDGTTSVGVTGVVASEE